MVQVKDREIILERMKLDFKPNIGKAQSLSGMKLDSESKMGREYYLSKSMKLD